MKTAHTLAQEYGCVYVEDLKTRNMTKSAKGTIDNPGKNVKQKSGLNRAILRTGFFGMRQAIEWQQYKVGGYVILPFPWLIRVASARHARARISAIDRVKRSFAASVAGMKTMPTLSAQ